MNNKYPNVIIVILFSLFAIIAVSLSGYWAETLSIDEYDLKYLVASIITIVTVMSVINNKEKAII